MQADQDLSLRCWRRIFPSEALYYTCMARAKLAGSMAWIQGLELELHFKYDTKQAGELPH